MRPAHEWLRVLGDVQVPVSLVQTLSEVVKDPQVLARRAVLPVPDSQEQLVSVRSPFRLASVPTPRNERFPELGGDTRVVLSALGFSEEEIVDLASLGAIGLGAQEVAS